MSITIVLEHTSHPGNIGAVARAMHTMGFSDLLLINPCEITDEAYLRARNGKHILENAQIHQTVNSLESFQIIYGTTSRHRSLNLPVYSSHAITSMIQSESHQEIAILFGNEKNGLSNDLLNTCQGIIEIPAVTGHSLNLSHAVQIICYELKGNPSIKIDQQYATLKERIDFIKWLQNYYQDSTFLLPHTLDRIQGIINKAKLTPEEVRLLYSLIASKPK
jgi:tRNA/rRNA methyltransferase